jgi:hypothetical protein
MTQRDIHPGSYRMAEDLPRYPVTQVSLILGPGSLDAHLAYLVSRPV